MEAIGNGSASFSSTSLTLLFVPTAYGSVDALHATQDASPAGAAPSLEAGMAQDRGAIRRQRVEQGLSELQHELSALRSELDALR